MTGKIILAFVVAALSMQLAMSATAVCRCTNNLDKVCGVDGITYSNECLLNLKRQAAEEPTPCTKEIALECGTNGVTYINGCLRELANVPLLKSGSCGDDSGLTLVKRQAAEEPTPCTMEIALECGTDGVTYINSCLRELANVPRLKSGSCGDDSGLTLVKRQAAEEPTPCTMEIALECGTDGITYINSCLRELANVPRLKSGSCGDDSGLTLVKRQAAEEPTPCTMEIALECGTDGVTYINGCLRELANVPRLKSGSCGDDSGLTLN